MPDAADTAEEPSQTPADEAFYPLHHDPVEAGISASWNVSFTGFPFFSTNSSRISRMFPVKGGFPLRFLSLRSHLSISLPIT